MSGTNSNNNNNDTSPALSHEPIDDDEKQCYICWESQRAGGEDDDDDDDDNNNNPIRRDCSCKGTMGYVHVRCLIQYLERGGDNETTLLVLRPWNRCPHCLAPYKGPTKAALHKFVWGNNGRQLVWSYLKTLTRGLFYYVALLLCRSCSLKAIELWIKRTMIPALVTLWEQAVVDYNSSGGGGGGGRWWWWLSPSILQLALCGCAVVATIVYFWEDIKVHVLRFVRVWILASIVAVAIVVVAEATGMNILFACATVALAGLSYWLYRNRAEMRQRGWLVTLSNRVLLLVAIYITLHIEYYIDAWLLKWRLGNDKGILDIIQTHQQRHMEERFEAHIQSMREDYWWCCS